MHWQPKRFSSLPGRTALSTLMEESPPPVPPKDAKYTPHMDLDRPSTAPTSGSKRKRTENFEILHDSDIHGDTEDDNAHTPNKRTRRSLRQSDASASEDAGPARNIRRKKGLRNLSQANLRHAAQSQADKQTMRESKFQEGSLTDKPSEKPPSLFTRRNSTRDVDELMEDYHNGMPTPKKSSDAGALSSQHVYPMEIDSTKKDEGAGFFQFGRAWAASFNPTSLWRKMWSEPVQPNAEEERKTKQKAEAEARYAHMKKAGQLGLQPVAKFTPGNDDVVETPRDSGIDFDGMDHSRSISQASGMPQPHDSESEAPDTTSKPTKTIRGRLQHLKKPSLTNIKQDLKRVGSDLNLGATLRKRESSSSLSPVKTDFPGHILQRSESRQDLKRRQKLSKRVSDLESQLARTRKELDQVLEAASPAPRFTPKYERFRTVKRPQFVPGKLPSLPSERVLQAEQAQAQSEDEGQPRKAFDLTSEVNEEEEGANDDTIRATRANKYPRRAASLFNIGKKAKKDTTSEQTKNKFTDNIEPSTQPDPSEDSEAMDESNNDVTYVPSENDEEATKNADYSTLDAKLKALEANVKLKNTKSKKRKSAGGEADKAFKPGRVTSDDDAEWEEATPKKKRKSTGNSGAQQVKKTSGKSSAKGSSPRAKNTRVSSPKNSGKGDDQPSEPLAPAQHDDNELKDEQEDLDQGHAADVDEAPARTSLDSQGQALDIVYEEDDDQATTQAPANTSPAKRSTRFGAPRSRSGSPLKRTLFSEPAKPEELMFTRAANAALRNRSTSPMAPRARDSFIAQDEDAVVTATPGKGEVPKLPKGARGSFETLSTVGDGMDEDGSMFDGGSAAEYETVIMGTEVVKMRRGGKGSFEWPGDCF
jgi:hypothetical protein